MSKSTKKGAPKPERRAAASGAAAGGFTVEERAAMRERAREVKAQARASRDAAEGEREVLARISEMADPDRALAERLHGIIRASAPSLTPRTWYGMPAYAKDGAIVCFFQSAGKFKTRYCSLGFNDAAHLDEGAMWPVAYALKELTVAEESRIRALLTRAIR